MSHYQHTKPIQDALEEISEELKGQKREKKPALLNRNNLIGLALILLCVITTITNPKTGDSILVETIATWITGVQP